MLTIMSEKTNLRDLTIAEIRRVAWQNIDPEEFIEDFNDLSFLARVNYAARKTIADWVDMGSILSVMDEPALQFIISTRKQVSRSCFMLDTEIFGNGKQFSLEFLTKNANNLYLDCAYKQNCITPEFIEKFRNKINYERFFSRFAESRNLNMLREYLIYKDGLFRPYIMNSKVMRYLDSEVLEELEQPIPAYYNTVITEQRIMSGQPCDDGQRSFTIWLRKFRRVTGRENDYPTWNEMLTLMKTHPRLNANGYVDWIIQRCLHNTPEEVSLYPERLSYRPDNVRREAYISVTGTDETQGEADFNIEFADVINPPVSESEVTISSNTDEDPESVLLTVQNMMSETAMEITPRVYTQDQVFSLRVPTYSEFVDDSGTDSPDSSLSDDED